MLLKAVSNIGQFFKIVGCLGLLFCVPSVITPLGHGGNTDYLYGVAFLGLVFFAIGFVITESVKLEIEERNYR